MPLTTKMVDLVIKEAVELIKFWAKVVSKTMTKQHREMVGAFVDIQFHPMLFIGVEGLYAENKTEITEANDAATFKQAYFEIPAYLGASAYLFLRGRDAYRDNPFEVEAYAVDQIADRFS